jgi:hypothetical protein
VENELKKLEEILGSKYEDWSDQTLAKILESEEAIKMLSPDMVVYLLENKKNSKVFGVLLPIKYGFDVRAIKRKIEEALKDHKENGLSLQDYKSRVLDIKKSHTNPIFRVAVYLTELASFGDDHDVSKDEKDIVSAMSDISDLMLSLKIDEGFKVITEILDMVFPVRELYFKRYKVDILKDNDKMRKVVDAVNAKAKEIFEFIKMTESISKEPDEEKGEETK